MNEETFISSIDCRFPYEDESQWRELILQGKTISDNATFMVLHEIARKPYGNPVSEKQQLEMVDSWEAENKQHPLAEYVIEAAKAIIVDKPLPIATLLDYMNKVQDYRNQLCALNILCFACDEPDFEVVEEKYWAIVESWKEHV
jgi:hypothetical protein